SIQNYGPGRGYVMLDGDRVDIRAGIHTLSGYSAHGDQKDLVNFVKRMKRPPAEVRLVHGDAEAKRELKQVIEKSCPECRVVIPHG
ncbi:MAG: MBL fold metallo-hydrolase RNA specificity domain-containing protein, partial [Candidatus Sedimenticola sp. (ex Thyasira tokunagai)]